MSCFPPISGFYPEMKKKKKKKKNQINFQVVRTVEIHILYKYTQKELALSSTIQKIMI